MKGAWLRRIDAWTALILLVSVTLSLYHLFSAKWYDYSNDAFEHRYYIEYLVQERAVPPSYEKAAYRHPPTYYFAAAAAYAAGEKIAGEEGALIAVKLLSMAFYAVFLVYGTMMLRHTVGSGIGYYAALALMAFWPLGLTLGARITCDIALYACIMATVYHLMRWQEHFDHAQLATALGWVAAGLLIKNNMLPWLPLIAVLIALGLMRRHYRPASLMRRDVVLACVAAATCAASTFLRGSMFRYAAPYQTSFTGGINAEGLVSLFRFDPLLFITTSIYRGINYYAEVIFFNLFLRSLVFDQFVWHSEVFTLLVAVCLLAVLTYLLISVPWMLARDAASRRRAEMLLCVLGGMMALLMLTYLAWRNPHYTNARYIYIIVPVMAALYGMAVRWHNRENRALLAGLGAGIAFSFSVLSAILLIAQHVKMLWLDIAN